MCLYIYTHTYTDAAEPRGRGAPDGAADRGRVRAAAVGARDGGGAEPGPGGALPFAVTSHEVIKRDIIKVPCILILT